MHDAKAMLLMCDDVTVGVTGKLNITGIFTGDLIIPENPTIINQIVVVFLLDFPIEDGPTPVALELSLPGEPNPRQMPLPAHIVLAAPGRTRRVYKTPFLLQAVELHCGKIEGSVICDNGKIYAGRIWVNTPQSFQELLKTARPN